MYSVHAGSMSVSVSIYLYVCIKLAFVPNRIAHFEVEVQ